MILPDSSVWIDHLRKSDKQLSRLLSQDEIVGHPFVTGEVSLGSIARRDVVLEKLSSLPQLRVASADQVRTLIDSEHLWGCGIAYVDAQLLASVRLTPGARLWTRDKRLHAQAERLGVDYNLA